MITTMDPLTLNPGNGIDDIIVSGFLASDRSMRPRTRLGWRQISIRACRRQVVAGRYPTNANECDVRRSRSDSATLRTRYTSSTERARCRSTSTGMARGTSRRPISPDSAANEVAGVFTELPGFNDRRYHEPADGRFSTRKSRSVFRCLAITKFPDTYCVGSEWTMQRVESLMNLPGYGLRPGAIRAAAEDIYPSQGMVLVEIYWEHEMLLKIPVLSPVFTVGRQRRWEDGDQRVGGVPAGGRSSRTLYSRRRKCERRERFETF